MKYSLSFIFLLSAFAQAFSQDDEDYFSDTELRYENYIYKENIKSVVMEINGIQLSYPFIPLNGEDVVRLDFDDLDGGYKNYTYGVVQCNADWSPSTLSTAQYISGFWENPLNSYAYSLNTLQSYTHYACLIPNENTRITKSGNYLLMVYEDFNKENIVLTRRFIVYEDLVSVEAHVKKATILSDSRYRHEIDFAIGTKGYKIDNAFTEVKIAIIQNGRWDNACTGLQPLFVQDHLLIYDYEDKNTFTAGNEFRHVDFRSLRFQSDRIKSLETEYNGYNVYLFPDERRSSLRYQSMADMNGQFYISMQEANDDDVEPDYARIYFSLKSERIPQEGSLYVFGALSDWQCKPEFKMSYNKETSQYEANALLKQGWYDYEYVFVPASDSLGIPDESIIEGTHTNAGQNYNLLIYHRPAGQYYDRVIAAKFLNSQRDF
jgi:hypothetical protein